MTTLGKYERLAEVARGSMGVIFTAYDPVLDRNVAIKVLRTGPETDLEIRQRFTREARTCAKLQHPNIVKIYDFGEVDQQVYIVMELLSGVDMRRQIQEKRKISIPQKIEYMAQVCDAIAYAHASRVIHRDLKPSNIFLTNQRTAVVLDFGIASLPSSTLTIVGKVLGTPNYMAPEQILGRACDERSDLFSAAVVFSEFLTNQHPFQSTFIPHRIVDSEPDSLCSVDSDIPVELEILLSQALAKDPNGRVQQAEELSRSLRSLAHRMLTESASSKPVVFGFHTAPTEPTLPEFSSPGFSGDPAEWRLSEFIRLLRRFDGLIESRSTKEAASVLNEMRGLNRDDERFTAAFAECQKKFEAATPNAAISTQPYAATSLNGPSGPNRSGPSVRGDLSSRPDELAPFARLRNLPLWHSKWAVSVGIGLVLLTIAAIVAALALTRQPIFPARGTAIVVCAPAVLKASASDQSRLFGYLHIGDKVNLLEIPSRSTRKWVKVQSVSGETRSPAVYAKVTDLGDWSGADSAAEWALIKGFSPHGVTGQEDVKKQVDRLKQFERKYPKAAERPAADLEIASLYVQAATSAQGDKSSEFAAYVEGAKTYIAGAGASQLHAARVNDLTHQLETLQTPPVVQTSSGAEQPGNDPPPAALTPEQRASFMRALQKAWDDGDVDVGLRTARSFWRSDPQNPQAKIWRAKFQSAKDALQLQ